MAVCETILAQCICSSGLQFGRRPPQVPRKGSGQGMLSTKTPQMRPSAASDRHEGLIRVIDSDYKLRVRDFWQGRAEVYDVNNTFHPPLCAHLVKVADILGGASVLDIATGTGHVAFAAADAVGSTGHVLGIDITESMLQQAKARAASTGRTNLDFQLGDVETITLPDRTFDFILCSNGMAYLQNIPAALERFHGWLKSGGRLCFNNPLAPMMPLTKTLTSICMDKFGVAPEDAGVFLGSEDNIRAALTSAGFQDIQVTGTQEVKVSPNTTPTQFAENTFRMMERFPAAPLSQLLTQQQIEELRADYMAVAVPQAEAMPQQDGGIVNQFVMLWAAATA